MRAHGTFPGTYDSPGHPFTRTAVWHFSRSALDAVFSISEQPVPWQYGNVFHLFSNACLDGARPGTPLDAGPGRYVSAHQLYAGLTNRRTDCLEARLLH